MNQTPNSKETKDIAMDIQSMTTKEIESKLDQLTVDLTKIRVQIQEAKSRAVLDGKYADVNWYKRVTIALKMKGRDHQLLQIEYGKRRRAERAKVAATFEKAFVDAARLLLDQETFNRLTEAAWQTNGLEQK